MKKLMGIDVGTSGVKCILMEPDGSVTASVTEGYPLYTPREGWSEQQPEDWWAASKKAVRSAMRQGGVRGADIMGIGFSGQMHGLVALDRDGRVVRPAILWNDQRTDAECEEIIRTAGGVDRLLDDTNNNMLTGYTGGKLLWLKKNEPDHFKRMTSFLMPKDYVRYRLTDEQATDVSDASGTGLFDVKNRKWSRALIRKLGLDEGIFPQACESTAEAGRITKEAAEQTGLPEGLPVTAGGGDAVIQSTGMGVVAAGTIGLIIGTSGIVSMSLSDFGRNTGGRLQYFCNNDPRLWQAFGCQLSSGGSLEWFKNTVFKDAHDPYGAINGEASVVAPGSGKLLFFPYLTGERCPYADPDARGVFFGLTSRHGRGEMARAVLEGVTFGLRQMYELIRAADPGLEPTEVISSGGGSKSPLWRKIQADVFGVTVKTLKGAAEGGAYGAAIAAGVTANVYKDIFQASGILKTDTRTEPDARNVRLYDELFRIYDGMYDRFKPGFDMLSRHAGHVV